METVLDRNHQALAPTLRLGDIDSPSADTTLSDVFSWVTVYGLEHLRHVEELAAEAVEDDPEHTVTTEIRRHFPSVANYIAEGQLQSGRVPSVMASFGRDGTLVFSIKWGRGIRNHCLSITRDGFTKLFSS